MSEELRIGDAEREAAAADLGEHFAQGRLSADEHAERLDQILAARTRAELAPLFSDLPGGAYGVRPATSPPYSSSSSSESARARAWRPGPLRRLPAPFFVVLAILVAIAVFTHLPIVLVGLLVWFVVFRNRGWHHRC